jgi:hypothetical protein
MSSILDFDSVSMNMDFYKDFVKQVKECFENPDTSRLPCNLLRARALEVQEDLIEFLKKLEKFGLKLQLD